MNLQGLILESLQKPGNILKILISHWIFFSKMCVLEEGHAAWKLGWGVVEGCERLCKLVPSIGQ